MNIKPLADRVLILPAPAEVILNDSRKKQCGSYAEGKDGKVDFTYTGMALNEYGWWYFSIVQPHLMLIDQFMPEATFQRTWLSFELFYQ